MSKPLIERMREWLNNGTPDGEEALLKDVEQAAELIEEAIEFFEVIGKVVK